MNTHLKWPTHWPDCFHPDFTEEKLAAMSPSKRRAADRHILKMQKLRQDVSDYLKEIDRLDKAGLCWCDKYRSCRLHCSYAAPGWSVKMPQGPEEKTDAGS